MNMNMSVNTADGGSPSSRGSRSPSGFYHLIQSPRATQILSPSNLPFLIIFFGAGFLIGGTWSRLGTHLQHDSNVVSVAHTHTTMSSLSLAMDSGTTNVNSYLRKPKTNVSLPIAWLMSFPVSCYNV